MQEQMGPERQFQNTPYGVVCIGFGTTAVSIAIALYETNATKNAIFLERQTQLTWTPCAHLPGGRMRLSFLNDLVVSENPRSKFTFVNYLHSTNRLVAYANSSQIRPSREMFTDYLRWCAAKFTPQVRFGRRVTAINAVEDGNGRVEAWKVGYSDQDTGKVDFVTARQVICAVGIQPRIPEVLSKHEYHASVIHSSVCLSAIPWVLRNTNRGCRFAIIGNGQDAAEIFDHLHSLRGQHRVSWFTRDRVLRRSDSTAL